jgi:TolB-like protein/DNA-binding winged helix-turn-helix (wHTH) protein/tetratricopeptide (TPR) repeat protein
MPESSDNVVFRFCDFELDASAGELFRSGEPIRLQPQQLQLLAALVRQSRRIVSRSELHAALWPGQTFGEFEDGLNHAIIRLRGVLGDSAQNPHFIETVPRRGYRFIAPVEIVASPSTDSVLVPDSVGAQTARRVKRRLVLAASSVIVAAGCLIVGWDYARKHDTAIHSVAILPLNNLTGDAGQQMFCDGVTEDLTTQLARINPSRVASRTSTARYKGGTKTVGEIARELSVDAVVEGAVQNSGDGVRITVQLIHAASDRHVWADTYEGAAGDIPVIEARVTRDLARQMKLDLTPEYDRRLRRVRPVTPEAYEAYQKGIRAARIWDSPHLLEAVDHLELAVQKDPDYAVAYAQLGHAYAMLGMISGLPLDENTTKFRALTKKVLELDPDLAEAHINLGDIRFYGDWDWSAGEKEFRRAVELDPASADAQEHYAMCLWALAKYDLAAREMRRALLLDPTSPRITSELAGILHDQGQPEDAIQHYREALELEPAYAAAFAGLGAIYEELGRDREAIAMYLRAASLGGESPDRVLMLSRAFEAHGMHGFWTKRLQLLKRQAKGQPVSPLTLAAVYTRLGDADSAIEWLNRAHDQHLPSLVWIKASRRWEPLRSDSRFKSLLTTMNLPPS